MNSPLRLETTWDLLFESFYILRKQLAPKYVNTENYFPILSDVEEKLYQLYILYEEAEKSNHLVCNDFRYNFKNSKIDRNTEWLRLKAKVESIYYLAHRIKKIFNKEIPGFSRFNPIGIRNVRNHYFEHPKQSYATDKRLSGNEAFFGITVYKKDNNGNWQKRDAEHYAKVFTDLAEFLQLLTQKINNQI